MEEAQVNNGQEVSSLDTAQEQVVNTTVETTEQVQEEINTYEVFNTKLGASIDYKDFPEDVDGLVNYTKNYADYRLNEFENTIQSKAPELYELLALALNDGDYKAVLNNWVNNQQTLQQYQVDDRVLVANELKSIGLLTDEQIKAAVDKMEDEGILNPKAQEIRTKKEQELSKANEESLKRQKQQEETVKLTAQKNYDTLAQSIKQGKLGNIEIPQSEREKFQQYFNDNFTYDTQSGKLYTYIELNDANDLANLFFRYRGGNIEDLVKIKAATQVANKFFNKQPATKEVKTGELSEKEYMEEMVKKMKGIIK
jgi:hypothetical protein